MPSSSAAAASTTEQHLPSNTIVTDEQLCGVDTRRAWPFYADRMAPTGEEAQITRRLQQLDLRLHDAVTRQQELRRQLGELEIQVAEDSQIRAELLRQLKNVQELGLDPSTIAAALSVTATAATVTSAIVKEKLRQDGETARTRIMQEHETERERIRKSGSPHQPP